MSLKWNSDREKFLADPEVADFYEELDAEFEAAKQVARQKRMLEHKGFTAVIVKEDCYCATEIKYKDNTLKDVISVHAETIEKLQEKFKISIDDYLDWVSMEQLAKSVEYLKLFGGSKERFKDIYNKGI